MADNFLTEFQDGLDMGFKKGYATAINDSVNEVKELLNSTNSKKKQLAYLEAIEHICKLSVVRGGGKNDD